MNKINGTKQTSKVTSGNVSTTTITINNTGNIYSSSNGGTAAAVNFPEDQAVKKILNQKKEKIYLDENVYVLAKGETINICLQKGNKEEIIFSATLSGWSNNRTELIYDITKRELKPIENLLKNRF